jgi:hypothetical protein
VTYQDLTYALFTHWPLKINANNKTYSLIIKSLYHPRDYLITFRGITQDDIVCYGMVNVNEHSKDFGTLTLTEL